MTVNGILSPEQQSGLNLARPEEKVCNLQASDPQYVYLFEGDAIVLEGPVVEASLGLCDAGSGNVTSQRSRGFTVKAGERLAYVFHGEDFEQEVALAKVDVWESDGKLASRFVLAAAADGIWHDMVVDAIVDGQLVASTASLTIESRPWAPRPGPYTSCATIRSEDAGASELVPTVQHPRMRQCDARASSPANVYLALGESVVIPGPPFPAGNASCIESAVALTPWSPDTNSNGGRIRTITISEELRYSLDQLSWNGVNQEHPLELLRVDFRRRGALMLSEFVFATRTTGTSVLNIWATSLAAPGTSGSAGSGDTVIEVGTH